MHLYKSNSFYLVLEHLALRLPLFARVDVIEGALPDVLQWEDDIDQQNETSSWECDALEHGKRWEVNRTDFKFEKELKS